MTPTTILIEREADTKVFEVLEAQYPEVRWRRGAKPTEFKVHIAVGKYVIVIKNDVLEWNYSHEYPYCITATEWLAQHGYVWDGDGYITQEDLTLKLHKHMKEEVRKHYEKQPTPERELQVGDTVVTERYTSNRYNPEWDSYMRKFVGVSGKITKISKDNHYEVHGWYWPRSACKYVAPVSASTRTEQREKELTDDAIPLNLSKVKAVIKDEDGKVVCELNERQVDMFLKNYRSADKPTQPAPYTAGQEVEYNQFNFKDGTNKWLKGEIDHIYNGILYLNIAGYKLPQPFEYHHIRPVQVHPEMPEWEKKVRNEDALTFAEYVSINDYKFYPEGWCMPGGSNGMHFTTHELYQKFLTEPAMKDRETPKTLQGKLEGIIYELTGEPNEENASRALILAQECLPLITPKQVTDDEIEAEASRLFPDRSAMRNGFYAGAEWALQKAEGGEG